MINICIYMYIYVYIFIYIYIYIYIRRGSSWVFLICSPFSWGPFRSGDFLLKISLALLIRTYTYVYTYIYIHTYSQMYIVCMHTLTDKGLLANLKFKL